MWKSILKHFCFNSDAFIDFIKLHVEPDIGHPLISRNLDIPWMCGSCNINITAAPGSFQIGQIGQYLDWEFVEAGLWDNSLQPNINLKSRVECQHLKLT